MKRKAVTSSLPEEFIQLAKAGGEVGKLLLTVDWSLSPVGPFEKWPQSLKTALSICLGTRFPMLVWWGQELTVFYNDAYIPFAVPMKHPQFLGRPASEQWAEIWESLAPLTQQVFQTGIATWSESMQLFMTRKGFLEETYFTFSYSPIRDETGAVGGIINPCQETTARILGERRLKTLRDLGAEKLSTESELGARFAKVLSDNVHDVPFAMIYLTEVDGNRATLYGEMGIEAATMATPLTIDVTKPTHDPWPLSRVNQSGHSERVDGLRSKFHRDLPHAPYDEGPDSAYILPIELAGKEEPAGFLILGISARLTFDENYKDFFELVSKHISTHLSNIRAIEMEKNRAEMLSEIDRAKTIFFSNVSHELRTPLTLILGPLEELLSSHEIPPKKLRMELELLHRNALRLKKLVNTLLDFSRIEAGRSEANYAPTNLSEYTADLASTFRSVIEHAGLNLVVDCPELPEKIYLDHEMWEKITFNLLSNAFKFTLEGTIRVQVRWAYDHAEFSVSDTGLGIPEQEIPKLFERFHRVEGTHGRSFEGTGIGLALVKEFVRLHGGSIDLKSELGKGTTFTVSIPGGSKHLPPNQIRQTQIKSAHQEASIPFVEEANRWVSSPEELPSNQAYPLQKTELVPNVSTARILLADDNRDMRNYMKRLLCERWQVEAVNDGLNALRQAKESQPDLIITDIMMPNLNGFELLQELKRCSETKDIPVIMLSARAGEEAKLQGFQKGADAYLVKPFSAKELIARTEALLEKNRQTVESLSRKNIELSQMNQELEQFAWLSSHDLKEPIRLIKLYSTILAEQLATGETSETMDSLQILKEGSSRMETIIEGLRTYALGRNEDIIDESVDCNAVIRDVLANLKVRIEETHAKISFNPLPSVKGNYSGLVRVFQSLISNSLKFISHEIPQIAIEATTKRGEWVFSIKDNGIGFENKYSNRIFLIGNRLHGEAKFAGAGMGLAICKAVIERHGGKLWADSQPGKGATFHFTIPKEKKKSRAKANEFSSFRQGISTSKTKIGIN